VEEAWEPEVLRETGQEAYGRAVGVHANARPPAGRAGTSTRRATQAGAAAPEARTAADRRCLRWLHVATLRLDLAGRGAPALR
jgi:hypothetical protein